MPKKFRSYAGGEKIRACITTKDVRRRLPANQGTTLGRKHENRLRIDVRCLGSRAVFDSEVGGGTSLPVPKKERRLGRHERRVNKIDHIITFEMSDLAMVDSHIEVLTASLP